MSICLIPVYLPTHEMQLVELLFVFVEAVFVAPRSEELGIAT